MILVAYASRHGSTEAIARAIAERLDERGKATDVRDVREVDRLDGLDAVVLGSAVYMGSWRPEAVALAERGATALSALPVWLFSSGPLWGQDPAEAVPKQIAGLAEAIRPRDHRVFFGALDPATLSFGERVIVKAVKAPPGDYRDWDDVRAWADGIADALNAPVARTA